MGPGSVRLGLVRVLISPVISNFTSMSVEETEELKLVAFAVGLKCLLYSQASPVILKR